MSAPMLPEPWVQKESSSNPGKFYYFNKSTGESTWEFPSVNLGKVRVRHILKKSRESRRPASWRNPSITQSKEEAIQQISEIRQSLEKVLSSEGYDAMHMKFQEVASKESDCSSAERGGDLDFFGRGQMQKPFEDASFALAVGELSAIVDTDSGIHILLRIA